MQEKLRRMFFDCSFIIDIWQGSKYALNGIYLLKVNNMNTRAR